MTEQKRKVLGINRNALTLNKTTHVSSTGRGTVLVITKGSKVKEQASQSAGSVAGSLTEQERNRRLAALQLAKKMREEHKVDDQSPEIVEKSSASTAANELSLSDPVSVEQIDLKEPKEQQDNSAQAIEPQADIEILNYQTQEVQSQEDHGTEIELDKITNPSPVLETNPKLDKKPQELSVREQQKHKAISSSSLTQISGSQSSAIHLRNNKTKQISLENVKEILQKGKMRNLDLMYKKPEAEIASTPEEENKPAALAEGVQAIRKVAAKAKQQTQAEAPKTKILGSKEEKSHKKPIKQSKQTQRKLSVSQMIQMTAGGNEDYEFRGARKKYKKDNKAQMSVEKIIREVMIPDVISVQELANRMAEKAANVIKALMKLGVMATLNQSIDADTAELVCEEFGHNFKRVTAAEILSNLLADEQDREEDLQARNPVVTIMGHVDHGKTSLLDALRSTDVVSGESGGITQHIGAYKVNLEGNKFITFLDTPGHEAFTAMRMRGAKVTDIVVLVVAADDGIKAQTVEAISHAKAANVPIIVAINKIDKPAANVEAVKNMLFQYDLVPDDMGGDTMIIPISAKQKIGLDKLEEAILLQADLLNLRANYNRAARGHVIEAHIDKGRGVVATFLVEKGILRPGDIIVVGNTFGKIRAMIDDKSHDIKSAEPSVPTEIIGLDNCPVAGDEFIVVSDEKIAKEIADFRLQQFNEKKHAITAKKTSSIEDLFSKAKSGLKELSIIVKADVQGSAEAIVQSLQKLANEEVAAKVLLGAVGGITESDVTLAVASKAVVLGFNVRANSAARDLAKNHNVEVQYYSIIYDLIDNVKKMLGGMLNPITKETIIGQIQIRKVFDTSKFGKIAGCYVTEGIIKRGVNARVLRDNIVIHEGKIKSLKRQKDDAREVKEGFECGISLEKFDDIKENDVIEAYEISSEKREF